MPKHRKEQRSINKQRVAAITSRVGRDDYRHGYPHLACKMQKEAAEEYMAARLAYAVWFYNDWEVS